MIGRAIPADEASPRPVAEAAEHEAPKRLALFADGTGNSSKSAEKTNVWRLFQALDQTDPRQLAYYDDGVGTSSNKYLATFGLVFGWGLKRNVIALYKFVCRNYDSAGTDIYAFGFSRGAFTIRVLVGLIESEGLVTFRSEEELDRNATAAYRHYRATGFPSRSPIVKAARWLRDALILAKERIKGYRTYEQVAAEVAKEKRKEIPIRFLGLWDTVEAYGMPIDELKRGIDWVLWPMMFGNTRLSARVARACHALSLDDERKSFHPLLWDEEAEAALVAEQKIPPGRITQVWFAGVHSNIGGGYPEDQLALISLEWMMTEASAAGLAIEDAAIDQVTDDRSAYARIYDSRAGFGAYYRYGPRRVPIARADTDAPILPVVHGSVVMRMAFGSDDYAPISLPYRFWVLSPDGQLLPMEGFEQPLRLDPTKTSTAGARLMRADDTTLAARRARLDQAIDSLARPDHAVVSLVWDTVFWRRALYFLTMTLTAVLAAYPWLGGLFSNIIQCVLRLIPFFGHSLAQDYAQMVGRTDDYARGPISGLVDILGGLIPSYASPWSKALLQHPAEFGSIAIAILVALGGSRILQARIRDRARLAWHDDRERRENYVAWLRESHVGWRNGMFVGFALSAVAFVVAIAVRTDGERRAELGVITAIFALLWLWRALAVEKGKKQDGAMLEEGTAALRLARWLRKNETINKVYVWIFGKAVPIAFALLLLVVGLELANRVLFDALSTVGVYCRGLPEDRSKVEKTAGTAKFSTDDVCGATGFVLQEGHTYRITIKTPGDWFDRTVRADVTGVAADGFAHRSATLLKRWWFEAYFAPIARIGRYGNDEYALKPGEKADAHEYCLDAEKHGGLPRGAGAAESRACRGGANARAGAAGVGTAAGKAYRTTPASTAPVSTAPLSVCGCCAAERPELEKETGRIARASAEKLMACTPTPDERGKLVAEITARSSGELFVYVNDAVLTLFGLTRHFYKNNSGTADITVERVHK